MAIAFQNWVTHSEIMASIFALILAGYSAEASTCINLSPSWIEITANAFESILGKQGDERGSC